MVIKSADDRAPDLAVLEGFLQRRDLPEATAKRIEQELRFMRAGLAGEKETAYEIDFYLGRSANWAVIHDLRLELPDGRVAQIDHLLINRLLEAWVLESKRFGEGIAINEHGECSAFFGGRPYGIPSPFEQNRKHCAVLDALLKSSQSPVPKRLGFSLTPVLRSLVVVSKGARITRPKRSLADLDSIVKADQLQSYLEKDNKPDLLWAARLIGSDTLESFARQLVGFHRPATFDWAAKFGLYPEPPEAPAPAVEEPAGTEAKKSKLVCAKCEVAVPYVVARFCWFNKPRFGGNVYCKECQPGFPAR